MEIFPTTPIVFQDPWEEGELSQVVKAPARVLVDSQQEFHISFEAKDPIFLIVEKLELLNGIINQFEGVLVLSLVVLNFFHELLCLLRQD